MTERVAVALNRAEHLVGYIKVAAPSTVRDARALLAAKFPDVMPASYRVFIDGLGAVDEDENLLDVVADGARKMRNGPPRMIVQDLAYVALKRQRDREEEYGNARKRRRLLVEVLEDIPAREAAAPAAETATTDVVAAAEEAAAAEQAAVDQAARIAGARAAAETAAAAEAKEAAANEAAANEAAANEAAANEAAAAETAANEAAANEAAATARALEQADAASRAALRAACAAVAAADDPAAVEVEYGVLLDDHARSLRRFAAACSRARRVVAPAWPADDEDVSGAALAERFDAARTEAFGAVEPCLPAQMDLLRADLAGAEGAVAAILEAPGDSRRESAASSFSERDEDDDSSAAVWAALEKHAGAFEAARARVAEELEVDAAIEASSASLEAAEAWARDAEAAVSEPRDWRAAATLDEAAARFEALSVAAVPHIVGLGARQEAIAALPARRAARNDLVDRARAVGERLVRHASGLKSHHEAVAGMAATARRWDATRRDALLAAAAALADAEARSELGALDGLARAIARPSGDDATSATLAAVRDDVVFCERILDEPRTYGAVSSGLIVDERSVYGREARARVDAWNEARELGARRKTREDRAEAAADRLAAAAAVAAALVVGRAARPADPAVDGAGLLAALAEISADGADAAVAGGAAALRDDVTSALGSYVASVREARRARREAIAAARGPLRDASRAAARAETSWDESALAALAGDLGAAVCGLREALAPAADAARLELARADAAAAGEAWDDDDDAPAAEDLAAAATAEAAVAARGRLASRAAAAVAARKARIQRAVARGEALARLVAPFAAAASDAARFDASAVNVTAHEASELATVLASAVDDALRGDADLGVHPEREVLEAAAAAAAARADDAKVSAEALILWKTTLSTLVGDEAAVRDAARAVEGVEAEVVALERGAAVTSARDAAERVKKAEAVKEGGGYAGSRLAAAKAGVAQLQRHGHPAAEAATRTLLDAEASLDAATKSVDASITFFFRAEKELAGLERAAETVVEAAAREAKTAAAALEAMRAPGPECWASEALRDARDAGAALLSGVAERAGDGSEAFERDVVWSDLDFVTTAERRRDAAAADTAEARSALAALEARLAEATAAERALAVYGQRLAALRAEVTAAAIPSTPLFATAGDVEDAMTVLTECATRLAAAKSSYVLDASLPEGHPGAADLKSAWAFALAALDKTADAVCDMMARLREQELPTWRRRDAIAAEIGAVLDRWHERMNAVASALDRLDAPAFEEAAALIAEEARKDVSQPLEDLERWEHAEAATLRARHDPRAERRRYWTRAIDGGDDVAATDATARGVRALRAVAGDLGPRLASLEASFESLGELPALALDEATSVDECKEELRRYDELAHAPLGRLGEETERVVGDGAAVSASCGGAAAIVAWAAAADAFVARLAARAEASRGKLGRIRGRLEELEEDDRMRREATSDPKAFAVAARRLASSLREALDGGLAALGDGPQVEALRSDWRRRKQEVDAASRLPRLKVGVVGQQGHGKSTLLNAVMNSRGLLPTDDKGACTAAAVDVVGNGEMANFRATATLLKPREWAAQEARLKADLEEGDAADADGDARAAALVAAQTLTAVYGVKVACAKDLPAHPKGEVLAAILADAPFTTSGADAKSLMAQMERYTKALPGVPSYWAAVRDFKLEGPFESDLTRHCVLCDLPGLNDANAARSNVARSRFAECDTLLVVLETTRAETNDILEEFLGESLLRESLVDGKLASIVVVVTKADINPHEAARKRAADPRVAAARERFDALEQRIALLEAASEEPNVAPMDALTLLRELADARRDRDAARTRLLSAAVSRRSSDVAASIEASVASKLREAGAAARAPEIHVCSAAQFLDLADGDAPLRDTPVFSTAEETGVPRLQELLRRRGWLKRRWCVEQTASQLSVWHASALTQLRALVGSAAPEAAAPPAELADKVRAAVEARLGDDGAAAAALRGAVRDGATRVSACFGALRGVLDATRGDANARARALLGDRSNIVAARQKAVVKRHGEFSSPSAGAIDWNRDVSGVFEEEVAGAWAASMNEDLVDALDAAVGAVRAAAAEEQAGLRRELAPLCVAAKLDEVESITTSDVANACARELRAMKARALEHSASTFRDSPGGVRAALVPGYDAASQIKGKGSKAAITDCLVDQAARRDVFMSVRASAAAALEALDGDLRRALDALVATHVAPKLRFHYKVLWEEPGASIQTGNPRASFVEHELIPKIADSQRRAEDLLRGHGIKLP